MPEDACRCGDHGYFAGESCPRCGEPGELILNGEQRRRLSKFASGALRHFPGDVGLDLDDGGWASLKSVVAAAERKYDWADEEAVEGVIATDRKGRFELDRQSGRVVVRAAYGHSVDVDLDDTDSVVPDTLYHGTAPRNLDAIRAEGLRPMTRQEVHLSGTVPAAREVGARHADEPVILEIDAASMATDGHRIVERGRGVYTTDWVPPAYLDGLVE